VNGIDANATSIRGDHAAPLLAGVVTGGQRTRKEPMTASYRLASLWKSSLGSAWNTKLIIVEPLNRK
jgi:hypothetical protein